MHIYRLAACISVLAISGRATLPPDVTPLDPFRHLRQECLADGSTRCAADPKVSNAAESGESAPPTPGTLEIKPDGLITDELMEHPSIIVQKYVPDKDDSEEILSFEAWKEKQFREAVNSDLVQDVESDQPEQPEKAEQGAQAGDTGVPTGQPKPAAGKLETEAQQEAPKQKVEDVKAKSNSSGGKQSSNPPHRYNYASPDCSARVISSSSSSQNAKSILHKSKDRYMLTPCNAKEHWVVVELCDEIRIEAVEIGMFEFFSGVVKEVVLSVDALEDDDTDEHEDPSNRTDSEWEQVAVFESKNVRGSQVFNLPNPTSFHRFIRLDFPSYYGKEYYCPISSVKAYGMNQMEAFKWESRRNKQREDEWARRQAQAEGKRRLSLPASPDPTSVEVAARADSATQSASHGEVPTYVKTQAAESTDQDRLPTPSSEGVSSDITATFDQRASTVLTATPADGTTATVLQLLETSAAQNQPHVNISVNTSNSASTAHKETTATITARDSNLPSVTPTETSKVANATITDLKATVSTDMPMQRTITSSDKREVHSNANSLSSSTSTRSVSAHTASSSPRQNNVKADSSESIYAFIIRRLNALEGNATLGMMYVEEQSRVNRGLLSQLERSWSQWKVEESQQQRLTAEKIRIASEETFEQLFAKMDQRDLISAETIAKLQNQLNSMTEEIAWEKRRGIAQLVLLLTVIALSALSRSATVDVQAVRPLLEGRKSVDAELQRLKRDLETAEADIVDNGQESVKSPLARARSLGHSKGSPRRPGTPINGNKKNRPALTLNAKAYSDRLDAPRTAIPVRSRHLMPPNVTPHHNGKRLARSSHLHTIDADRVRRKMQLESSDLPATPSKSFSGVAASPFVTTPTGRRSTENAVAESEFSEYELASASEAEGELDMAQGGFTV